MTKPKENHPEPLEPYPCETGLPPGSSLEVLEETGWFAVHATRQNREVLRPSILLALAQIDQITFPLHADFYISNASKAFHAGNTAMLPLFSPYMTDTRQYRDG